MKEITEKTVFGKLVKTYSLRRNTRVADCHIEYYEIKMPKGNKIPQYLIKELYKIFLQLSRL